VKFVVSLREKFVVFFRGVVLAAFGEPSCEDV